MRFRKSLSILVLALSIASCATSKRYPPAGFTEDSWDFYIQEDLALYGERPLVPKADTQVYRFLLRPANGISAMVRIEHSEGRTVYLAKRYGYAFEPLEVTGELSAADWEAFLKKVYETEFWLSDTREERAYALSQLPRELEIDAPMARGATYADFQVWFLEASNGRIYHIASEVDPRRDESIYELGTLMMDLVGVSEVQR